MVNTWISVILFSLLFGMFELFYIKIKMFKVKIANLFLSFQLNDFFFISSDGWFHYLMLLKFFDVYHTPKKWKYYICFISVHLWGRRMNIWSRPCECVAYVKVTAHERFVTFGIKDNFDRRTQVGKKQTRSKEISFSRLRKVMKS